MALKLTCQTVHGLTVPDAYLRVEGVTLTKSSMAFTLRSYADVVKPAFTDEAFNCAYDINGENPFRQAYLHLKTLPAFSGATDA